VPKQERKRLNVEIPLSLFSRFQAIINERDILIAEGIREAVKEWVDREIERKMIEGFKACAKEDLELMEEFKYVDMENWD